MGIDLDDVFGSVSTGAAAGSGTTSGGASSTGGGLAGLEDIFGAPALTPNNGGGAPANNAAGNTHTAYDKNGVRIQMLGQKHPTNPSLSMIQAQFTTLRRRLSTTFKCRLPFLNIL